MSSLLWPGDHRAGALMTDATLLRLMVDVEAAWLQALVDTGIADAVAADPLDDLVGAEDLRALAVDAEDGGNPVIPLVALLRRRVGERNPATASWRHRGLTSQDVLDTALILGGRDVIAAVVSELRAQVDALVHLADHHRATPMVGRTLTQHAAPLTFGLKVSTWRDGVIDAAEALTPELPAQLGGAAGNRSVATELARLAGLDDPPKRAFEVADRTAGVLGLLARTPWHTARAPITGFGDALAGCTGAWGRIANDVLTLARPEIAEVFEPQADGRGGFVSTAPEEEPIAVGAGAPRRTGRPGAGRPAAPGRGHRRPRPPGLRRSRRPHAPPGDERPDGAWHLEWLALQQLGRHTVTAAAQTTELLSGLQVDAERMRATLAAARPGIDSEQRSLAALFDGPPPPDDNLGANDLIIDAALDRARTWRERTR